jgi:hypothetical protein
MHLTALCLCPPLLAGSVAERVSPRSSLTHGSAALPQSRLKAIADGRQRDMRRREMQAVERELAASRHADALQMRCYELEQALHDTRRDGVGASDHRSRSHSAEVPAAVLRRRTKSDGTLHHRVVVSDAVLSSVWQTIAVVALCARAMYLTVCCSSPQQLFLARSAIGFALQWCL